MVETATPALRLLIVDDDNLICWALGQEFSGHARAISLCRDGKDALARIRCESYDFAIVDVHLPDADGIAILEEIRRVSPGTRVIVMSAVADAARIRRAIAAGAAQFVEKPFDPSAIRGRVMAMFRDHPVPRMHPRYDCRIKVGMSLLAPLPPGAGFDLDNLGGIAEEVGVGGLRVATSYPLAAGQVVRVKAVSADAADPFLTLIPPHATAVVRWATVAPGGFRAGLSFRKPLVPPQVSPEGAA